MGYLFPFSCDFVSLPMFPSKKLAKTYHNLLLSFVHLFTFGCFCKGTQMEIQQLTGSKCALNV